MKQSVASAAALKGAVARYMVLETAKDLEEGLFKKRTVGEFLFHGTYEPLVAELSDLNKEELMPNNTFGIYYGVSIIQ
jgi:hypothetical protein